MCFQICILFTIITATFSSSEINKNDGSKVAYTKERSDLIKSDKKSTISPYRRGSNQVDDSRNYSASEFFTISDGESSAAVNKFLESVSKAQNDLKWMDDAMHRVNHKAHPNPLARMAEYSTGSANMKGVLGQVGIDYGSRLRGKRGFDRNYETMWMLQKKKYGGESIRDVPQRIHLNNDVTFKRNADITDLDAAYRSSRTLDRAVYAKGANQPLDDWSRKKDLLSSSNDWSDSNKDLKVIYGESLRLRGYEPARETFVNSDSKKNEEKLHTDTDTWHPSEIVSLYDPMHADDSRTLREFPIAIENEKTQNASLSLESLRKRVLELRDSLTSNNKKENMIFPKGPVAEIFDLENHDLDEHLNEKAKWRIKRMKNIKDQDKSNLEIFQTVGFEGSYPKKRNSKKSHYYGKRNRRSSVEDFTNQTNISENKAPYKTQLKNVVENATEMHSLDYIITSELSSSWEIIQSSRTETPSSIDHINMKLSNSFNFEKNLPLSNVSINAIRLSTNGDANDSRRSAKNHNTEEKSRVATRKISPVGSSDGQSREELLRGNTSWSFGAATNESRGFVVGTSTVGKAGEIAANKTERKEKREPIPGVIKISELQGRPNQRQEAEAGLSRQMEEDRVFTRRRTSDVDESRNVNAQGGSSGTPIDLVGDKASKLAVATTYWTGESITASDRSRDSASMILDNDLRKQQMVPSLGEEDTNANKSNGNSNIDGIDIRALGPDGNETMNVRGGIRTMVEAREHHELNDNLRRKLLWISMTPADEDRQQSEIISAGSSHSEKLEDNNKENTVLRINLNADIPDTKYYVRHKRSMYPHESFELDNKVDSKNVAIEKRATNPDGKQDNEEYLDQTVNELIGNDKDIEEAIIEENSRVTENRKPKREKLSLPHQHIDSMKARVDMLIKQRLDMKNKKSGHYERKKRNALDMIEYYDYDSEEEREMENANDRLSIKDKAKMKRDDKTESSPVALVKKKNEYREMMKKAEREKMQLKNKKPKEEIVVNLGKPKNKTAKTGQKDRKAISGFGEIFNEKERSPDKENSEEIRHSENIASNIYHEESADAKSKWLNEPFEQRMTSKNSDLAIGDDYKEKINVDEPVKYISNEYVDVNPDIIENILLEPIKILEQTKKLQDFEDFYKDYENQRPEDHYQESDRRQSNDVEYEELKKIYDWPDGELKSGPRLRGDQRLRYESDDNFDTKSSQLLPLDDKSFDSSQNDDAQKGLHLVDPSLTTASVIVTPSNYIADDMFKGSIGLEQGSSVKENSPSVFSVSTSTESRIYKIIESKNSLPAEEDALKPSLIDTDSGSPYENGKYIESELHKVLNGNLDSKKQAAISLRDLHESFVESMNLHDDLEDNVKVRFGRGLKAADETSNSDASQTHDKNDELNMTNATDRNSELRNLLQIFPNDSSISQSWHNNITADLPNVLSYNMIDHNTEEIHDSNPMYAINIDGDLEAAEQGYLNHQMPRIRRAVLPYRTFYDAAIQDRRDFDHVHGSHYLPNVFETHSDNMYRGYVTPNSDIGNLDRYAKISRSSDSRENEKARKKSKKKKKKQPAKILEKHAKKDKSYSSSSISQRNRRKHARPSDTLKNSNRSKWKLKKKKKSQAEASRSVGRSQKSRLSDQGHGAGLNEASGERVLYENVEDQSTVKPKEDDARRKEITLLLAADNVDDESQMDVALHGELAGKIVERIFEQVHANDRLRTVFGPGLHRNYKTEDVIKTSKTYLQRLDEDGTNHTEVMMKRIMELLGRLILNEVQRKTCVSLSPDMQEFLGWMLGMDREEELLEEAPPLPLVHKEAVPEENSGRKFLFDNAPEQEGEDIRDLQKKVRTLETLVNEYNTLTAKEKMRVQTVHDYLMRQLNLLLRYIEAQQAAQTKTRSVPMVTGAVRTGNILQYQNAVPNAASRYSMTKDAFSSSNSTHNLSRFNNASFNMENQQFYDNHALPGRRRMRSLDKVPSTQHRGRKLTHRKPKRMRKKYRKRQDSATSASSYRRSREKRANPEKDWDMLYLGYEAPTIYDSFDIINAKLAGKEKKRKRELTDKRNAENENNRMLDLLPIKGKNRLEDEVILLNKREAWKRKNEDQLEEVAFGKDMRNSTKRDKGRLEKLTEGDKRKPIVETGSRTKRQDIIGTEISTNTSSTNGSNYSRTATEIDSGRESAKDLEANNDNNDNGGRNEDKIKLVERKINVFAENKTDPAIVTLNTKVSEDGKLAINAVADNRVKGKLGAINCETKIDNGGTSFVNLTSGAEPPVSKERRKVSEVEKAAADNAVKLNRATNYRSEEIDPEIELKNLGEPREKKIYGVTDWSNSIYDDDNLSRNKLKEKYMAKLDELGDPNAATENNLGLSRLRSNKRSYDVVEWKMTPIIKRSPYYDNRASSRFAFMEKEEAPMLNARDVEIDSDAYLNNRRGIRRNGAFNVAPVLRIIDESHRFSHGIHPRTKRLFQTANFVDRRMRPKILLEAREPSRNDEGSSDAMEFEMHPALRKPNGEFRVITRSRDDPELDDRAIYDGVRLRLPVCRLYYDDFTDSAVFHLIPDIPERNSDVYRYPTRAYLEYSPFKERPRDSNRRAARRNSLRSRISEKAADLPGHNLAGNNSASNSRHAREEFRVEAASANRGDYLAPDEAKYTRKSASARNEDKTRNRVS